MSDLPSYEQPEKPLEFMPGEVVLRVEPDAVRGHVSSARALRFDPDEAEALPASLTGPLDYLRVNAGLRAIRPVLSRRRAAFERVRAGRRVKQRLGVAASVIDSAPVEGLSLGTLPARNITPDLLKLVEDSPAVRLIERVPARWLTASPATPDPARNLQWGLRATGWFDANLPDMSDLAVGILDSGIDTTHPDFAGLEIDYVHDGTSRTDVIGHGTHVAGTIASAVNDRVGTAGMGRVRLKVWKVFPDEPQQGTNFYIDPERYIQAIHAVVESDIKVLNLSVAGANKAMFEQDAFGELRKAGVLAVAAMGNGFRKGNDTMYPAAGEGVFAVGSLAEDRTRSDFSNTGPHIDLAAPGSNVLSTHPVRRSKYREKRHYAVKSGTSMATAHVSAAAAMVSARHPTWDADRIAERLRSSAEPLGEMGGRDRTDEHGAGLLNLRAALL
jgi:subtilisin family serine protease